jgi:prolyl-tRNA editing enzyme YbaK/EbsC (Cys-tRNA(Pro) deacylase)
MIESSKAIEQVRLAFSAAGVPCDVKEMRSTTRTAQAAALAIGCGVAQIAKSLIFRGQVSETAILVIAGGALRVDEVDSEGRCPRRSIISPLHPR